MPTQLSIHISFVKGTHPSAFHSFYVPEDSVHREILVNSNRGDHVSLLDIAIPKRFEGEIIKKEYFLNPQNEYEIKLTALEAPPRLPS